MPEAFSAVPDDHFVFRLATDSFAPPGASTPQRSWLILTTEDKNKAEERKRPPALSGFDQAFTTASQALALLRWQESRHFGMKAGEWIRIGADHGRSIAVVYLPFVASKHLAGWQGHVLIEGTRKPEGVPKQKQYDFLDALCIACQES